MAHKNHGVKPIEWWKHLRWRKRTQNRLVRMFGKKIIKQELNDGIRKENA